jgi:hypothetical protein
MSKRRLSTKSYEELEDPTHHAFTVTKNKRIHSLTLDSSGQHTLHWKEHKLDKGLVLPAGSCNLYLYPIATLAGKTAPLTGSLLEALSEIILGTPDHILHVPDAVGALPIHAVLVANNPAAIGLAMEFYRATPEYMLMIHQPPGPFIGENCLHVLAVNSYEDEICECVELAMTRLDVDKQTALFTSQSAGVFFENPPQNFYGGTPLAYACCFCLKRAVAVMINTGLVGLNVQEDRCVVSGFLPLHAVVANGLKDMYNWLTTGKGKPGEPTLEEAQLADTTQVVMDRRLTAMGMAHTSPMQLAAVLGYPKMFTFVLRKQTNVLWKWGPVTQYEIDLDGVDSAGDTECDVMEIIGRLDCKKETQEMLLDSFMQGSIHKLYEEKWYRYGAPIHYIKLVMHLMYLGQLAWMAFSLKSNPMETTNSKTNPALLLGFLVIIVIDEVNVWRLWWENAGETNSISMKFYDAYMWASSFQIDLRMFGYMCTMGACVLILQSPVWTDDPPDEGETERRLLKSRGGDGGGGGGGGDGLISTSGNFGGSAYHELTMLLTAIGLFTKGFWLQYNILTPFQRLGVFMLSVSRMLRQDILTFMILFAFFIANFYCLLYITYPREGEESLPFAQQFNDPWVALQAVISLAFLGDSMSLILQPEDLAALTSWQRLNIVVFIVVYVFYILMSIILLLNLLIAMLGNTFTAVYDQSTLEWRLMFARYVLRLELSARSLAIWELRVGTPTLAGKFTISFQDVAANAEGGGASGNPFEDFEDTKEDKEDNTEKLLAKMDAAIGGGLFARPPTNDSPIVSFSSPGSKTPSTVAADDNGVKSDVKELMSAMRALQAEQKALAKQLARIVDKKQVHVSATVLGQ